MLGVGAAEAQGMLRLSKLLHMAALGMVSARSVRALGSPSHWLLHAPCLAPPLRQACQEPPSGAPCRGNVGQLLAAQQRLGRRCFAKGEHQLTWSLRGPRKVLQGFRSTLATSRSPTHHSLLLLLARQAGTMCPCFCSLGAVRNRSPEPLLHSKQDSCELHASSFLG